MGSAPRRLRRNSSLDDKDDVGHAIVIVGIAADVAILLAICRDGEIAIDGRDGNLHVSGLNDSPVDLARRVSHRQELGRARGFDRIAARQDLEA